MSVEIDEGMSEQAGETAHGLGIFAESIFGSTFGSESATIDGGGKEGVRALTDGFTCEAREVFRVGACRVGVAERLIVFLIVMSELDNEPVA